MEGEWEIKKNLTQKEKDILKALYDNSFPCPQDITLYRTDKTNWLEDIFQNDKMFHINTLLQTTMDKDLVIKDNEGKVKQRMEISISKGTKIFCPNNADEWEIDIPYKYNAAILNKRFNEKRNSCIYNSNILSIKKENNNGKRTK